MKRLMSMCIIACGLVFTNHQALSIMIGSYPTVTATIEEPTSIKLTKPAEYCCLEAESVKGLVNSIILTTIDDTNYELSFFTSQIGTDIINIYENPKCGDRFLANKVLVKITSENIYYVPCYRFWNQTLSSQILLVDDDDIKRFKDHPEWGWVNEGIQFYVIKQGVLPTE